MAFAAPRKRGGSRFYLSCLSILYSILLSSSNLARERKDIYNNKGSTRRIMREISIGYSSLHTACADGRTEPLANLS